MYFYSFLDNATKEKAFHSIEREFALAHLQAGGKITITPSEDHIRCYRALDVIPAFNPECGQAIHQHIEVVVERYVRTAS